MAHSRFRNWFEVVYKNKRECVSRTSPIIWERALLWIHRSKFNVRFLLSNNRLHTSVLLFKIKSFIINKFSFFPFLWYLSLDSKKKINKTPEKHLPFVTADILFCFQNKKNSLAKINWFDDFNWMTRKQKCTNLTWNLTLPIEKYAPNKKQNKI